ncbi:unnamed protein product [Clonostachys rosea f. rosea IK726]|uniref:Uncharacterized protein n=1 Tax=Clonostachys rosea f. rosea IK726 TaxID=1349383 RepID=A0ACA9UPE0_BIOOC|nr:unnamed protein product [Clonostachys rosea f. rosea IK726]
MRLPYVSPSVFEADAEAQQVAARIEQRRRPRPLQPLDLTLLHSPPVADGWNSFIGNIRSKTLISNDIRELAISRVAVLNRAWYEWMHHAPLAIKAGVPREAMDALKSDTLSQRSGRPSYFTEKQWAVVVLTDEMTRDVQVKDETMEWIKGLMSDRDLVETVSVIASYNCVSRFLVALDGSCISFTVLKAKSDCHLPVGERNHTTPESIS